MDKILVHATSLNNLSNILISGFLAHPSLAILNNEQKQSSNKFTPLEHLSFNFGNVVFIANPNNVLNKHNVNIYSCDSASVTLPALKPQYVSSVELKNQKLQNIDIIDELHGWFKLNFPEKQDAVDFYFSNYQNNNTHDDNKNGFPNQLIYVQMENLYFILKNYDLIEQFNKQSKLSDIQEIFYSYQKQDHVLDHKMQIWMIDVIMSKSQHFNNKFAFQADNTLKNHIAKIEPELQNSITYMSFNQSKMEMLEKMHQDGLMKFYISKNRTDIDNSKHQSNYIEFTKENINMYFKKHNGLEKLTESDLDRLDGFDEWEEYQLIAAITPKIQVSHLTNHLHQLNKQELLEHIESRKNNFDVNQQKIEFDDVNQQKQFELDCEFIDQLVVNKPLEPFEHFEKYILKSYKLNPSDVEYFLKPAIIDLSCEKEYFKHDQFKKYSDILDVAIDELTYELNEKKKNTLIKSLTYFGNQVSQNLFSLYYEVKANDCLDINADNFSHVLLPKPQTHDEHQIIQHLSNKLVELGVKPVLYVRNNTIQLEKDYMKEFLGNMEINNVVTNLINNNEVKIVNDFQYQSLNLDDVKNNQVTIKKRYKMK